MTRKTKTQEPELNDSLDSLDAMIAGTDADVEPEAETEETLHAPVPEVIANITDDIDGLKLEGVMLGIHLKDIELMTTPYMATAILQGIAEKLQFRRVTSTQYIDRIMDQASAKIDQHSSEKNHVDPKTLQLEGLSDAQRESILANEDEIETINETFKDLYEFFGRVDQWNQKLLRRTDAEVLRDLEKSQARKARNEIVQDAESKAWIRERRQKERDMLAAAK